MSTKPTLVFVPGAWHSASTWDKVIALTSKEGYKSIAVTLASASPNPAATLEDDIKAVRSIILSETSQGRDVVVVVHSYGGFVGVSSIQGLSKSSSTSSSTDGHVLGFAMMATGFAAESAAFLDATGGVPPPIWKIDQESGFAVLTVEPRDLFYHDLPVEEGEFWVSKLEKQAAQVFVSGGEHVHTGWKDVPVWMLITTDDHAFPPEVQRFLVQDAQNQGGDITVKEIHSSHSPMLSQPDETAKFILEAVDAFMN